MSPPTAPSGRRWSLRAKLVATVVVLFALVTSAVGLATVALTRDYLQGQLDDAVRAASQRATGGPPGRAAPSRAAGAGPRTPGSLGPGPGGSDATLRLALEGDAVVRDPFGRAINTAVTPANRDVALTTAEIAAVRRAAGATGAPTTVDLGDRLGTYRVMAAGVASADGGTATFFTGLPTAGVDRVVRRLELLTGAGVLAGLLLVAAGGAFAVRRNLEPLSRVAATAGRVSAMRLDSGEVSLADRVDASDTDPRTEVGRVGAALNRLLDNVEDSLRARQASEQRVRRFVSDASHELRTPLASIRGYAELSRLGAVQMSPEIAHAVGRIESEAVRMGTLVDDLLLLARLDEGRPLEREPVDVTELVVNAVSDAHAAAPDHVWQLDVPDASVTVTGDAARLHQVIANLLGNARTHTPPGTRVVTAVAREADRVRISVTDDGPGVPPELGDAVFDRFARADSSRSRAAGSTGLGLSIAAAVAHAHGGDVTLESRPGCTRFSLSLPATEG